MTNPTQNHNFDYLEGVLPSKILNSVRRYKISINLPSFDSIVIQNLMKTNTRNGTRTKKQTKKQSKKQIKSNKEQKQAEKQTKKS